MTRTLPRLALMSLAACGPADGGDDPPPPPPPAWSAQALVDGAWIEAGEVVRQGDRTWVRYTAADDGVLGGLALTAAVAAPDGGAKGWLSNGFQSWSQSGVVQVPAAIEPATRAAALRELGDAEVHRKGDTHSWWHTFVDLGDSSLVAGITTAERFKSWASVEGAETLEIRLVSGDAGEALSISAGDTVEGERWFVERVHTADLPAALRRYGAAVPSRRLAVADPAARPAPDLGWNSWYDLWDDVTEDDIRANAPLVRQAYDAAGVPADEPLRIVIDDGWQVAWGDWTTNDKFPSGMDGLAADLKADGHEVGIWLAPLLVDAGLPLVADKPDWFLDGGAQTWRHPVHGAMAILDTTHPDAAAHLTASLQRIVGWGYDLLKIDFLFAGTFEATTEGGRHDPAAAPTGMAAFSHTMRTIRAAVGEETLLLAVASPAVPTLAHVDSWRLGHDIAYKPVDVAWPFIMNQLRGLSARWFLCEATLCDADPPLLRTLPRGEVEGGAWTVALAGGGLYLSDDLPALPSERLGWALTPDLLALARSGRAGHPADPFSPAAPATLISAIEDLAREDASHVVPTRWTTQDGAEMLVGR